MFVLPEEEKQAKFVVLKSMLIQGLHPTACFRQDKELRAKLNSDLASLGKGLNTESFDHVLLSPQTRHELCKLKAFMRRNGNLFQC